MRNILIVAALLVTGAALAQPPESPRKVEIQDELSIPLGYSEILQFTQPFSTINVATQGIVRASAKTDRTMVLTGEAEGSTIMFVYGEDGRELYSTRINVTAERGHSVKVYSKQATHEYHAYYCNETTCSRVGDKYEGPRDEPMRKTTIIGPNGQTTVRGTTNPYQGNSPGF